MKRCEQQNLKVKCSCPYQYAGYCTFTNGMVTQLSKCELIKRG